MNKNVNVSEISVTNHFHVCTIFTQMMRVDNKNATKEFFVEFRMQVCKFDWQEEWKKVADNLFKLGTSLNYWKHYFKYSTVQFTSCPKTFSSYYAADYILFIWSKVWTRNHVDYNNGQSLGIDLV